MIHVKDLTVSAGTFRLEHVSFKIPTGHYAILMGKTGSGKTTILESLCGLKSVEAGQIDLMGRNVTRLKPAERGIGFVPQEGALFPKMTVGRQLGFALAIRRWKRDAVADRVEELARLLDIEHLLDRRPTGLSGGERQRVALGRALAARPNVLCLDEPLSALDDTTRHTMCSLLKTISKQTGVTTLHITHNRSEAENLGDIFLQLEDGVVHTVNDEGVALPYPPDAETPYESRPIPGADIIDADR
ncbi:MAG: ABC transporter ATP-binding protein, partial [Planctomycetaceae bacterium]|nr:ABC transporter ATP-binding protein [Planctomycetaceae bacterium]